MASFNSVRDDKKVAVLYCTFAIADNEDGFSSVKCDQMDVHLKQSIIAFNQDKKQVRC